MKPWDMNWTEQVNPQDYNGSYLQSTDGSDAKPFEKLNLFLRDFGAEAKPSDKTFGELASGFFKNIGTFEVKKAQRTPEQQQRIDTISKAFEGEVDTGEVAKGFARGTLELSKGTGGLVKMLGDWWRDEQDSTNLLPSEIKRLQYNNFGADALVKTGQWIQDLSDMGLESDLLQQDPETFKGSFTENPSLTRTLSTVASGIPSLAYGWGMSKLTNPVLGVSLMSGVDTQDMYWEAKEAGKSKAEAGAIFTVATAGTYAFEKIGFDSIFEKKITPLAVKITGSMITEGLTEGGQTLYQNLVKKIGYDETQNMFEGVVESIVAGAGSGGLASAAVGVSNKLTRAETVLKNQGYSDNDISVMEEAIGNEMIAHKDTIEPMLQENITKSINNLNALKEKFAGLPEQTRQQISRELEEIYGTVRNKLKGVVDDVEADSIAKLQQGRALYMYEATGMMPSEYAKKMPEIRRAENIEQANFNLSPESDNIYYQTEEEKELVVSHATTLDKLEEALELGAMPMPSLAVTKAEYAGKSNFGEIVFIGGSNIIDPNIDVRNKTFTADIYSTRKVSPTFEITKDGVEYIKRQTGNISKQGSSYWVANISSDLERGSDIHLKEIYLASKGKITDLDGSTYSIVQSMTEKEKADFSVWKRKFINEYTDKKIFEGFTPSGNRKFVPYDLKNILRIMQKQNLKGSESIAGGNAHALRGIWAKELKSIEEIRKEKGRIVDEQIYQEMDNVIWDETTKLSDLLVSEKKAEELEASWIAPDEYMINEALALIKPNSNIQKILEKADLRSDKKAVDAVKRYMKLVNDLPVKYFESKPQRAVDFSEFKGVIMPESSEYNNVARELEDRGLLVIRKPNYIDAMSEFRDVFFQNESSPYGAYSNNIVYLFQKANRSTLAHELAHSWHNELLSMQEYDKIKQDLETFDRWSENEFNRKYKVEQRDNGYAVVNKQGNVVYDRNGNGFMSERDAKDYAKEELFARGFEEYLREGKAPSNALKQAFRNFLMWLKKLYKDAMALNIELSPDMKNFYADILGGADLDFFLNSTPETFIENRVNLGQEREAELDTIISDAQNDKTQKVKSKTGKRLKDIWVTSMIPLSTRAKRVSPKLRTRLRRYEFELLTNLRDRYNKALPFLNIWKTMSENDAIAFDLALKNDYVSKQLEIVDKYNARKEWESVRELLTSIYDDAINAGLDLNYRPDYFPRRVKDVDGFLSYLRNSPEWTRFEEAIRDADPYNTFTVEEKADFLNKYLRGFVRVDLLPTKYSSEKKRKIDIINNEMNKFYADSAESLIMYIEGMNKRIESAKFLGKGSDNYDESIGGYLTYLLDNNIIDPKKVDEVRDILSARFNERGVSNLGLKSLRDVSYMYTMGGINSAITQIDDLSTSMYKAGIWNTLSTALSSKRITRKDLGLDVVSDEFRDSAATAKALNKLFKLTGLDAIDGFAKETLVNAVVKKYRQYSDKTLREVIEPIMEEDTGQTIEDIRNNNITDNVLFLVFNDLSDVQPISKSELPAFYNTSGNLRILYMLKSFMIKRIDIFRNECYDKIKDPKTRVQGIQNLVRLTVFMMLLGASKDMLINLLYGRDIDISEIMVNNALGLAGISKFQVYQAKEKGFTSVLKDFSVPPVFAIYDDLINDVNKVSEGKRDFKNLEVLKGIPLVGRFYYWWVGRGKEKLENRNKKKY